MFSFLLLSTFTTTSLFHFLETYCMCTETSHVQLWTWTLQEKGHRHREQEFTRYSDPLDRIQGTNADFRLLDKVYLISPRLWMKQKPRETNLAFQSGLKSFFFFFKRKKGTELLKIPWDEKDQDHRVIFLNVIKTIFLIKRISKVHCCTNSGTRGPYYLPLILVHHLLLHQVLSVAAPAIPSRCSLSSIVTAFPPACPRVMSAVQPEWFLS